MGFELGEHNFEAHQLGEGEQGRHHELGPVQETLSISPHLCRGQGSWEPRAIIKMPKALRHFLRARPVLRRLHGSTYLIFSTALGGKFYIPIL